jgi:hypothetical protein
MVEHWDDSPAARLRTPGPPNTELKLTKPAQAMELRSLTPVFDRPMWTHEGRVLPYGLVPAVGPTYVGSER